MRAALGQLRKLVLGETWSLPLGLTGALLAAAGLRIAAGDASWWPSAGGFVLLALVVLALSGSLLGAHLRR